MGCGVGARVGIGQGWVMGCGVGARVGSQAALQLLFDRGVMATDLGSGYDRGVMATDL